MSEPLFQNTFILKKPSVASFPDIAKIATVSVKTTFIDSKRKKLKELKTMY